MADKHFEQQVQERMEEFKLSPSAPVWMNIEAQLKKDKRRRWLFFLLLTGVLLSIGSFLYYNTRSSVQTPVTLQESASQPVTGQSQTNSEIISDTPEPVNHSNQSSTNTQATVESQKPVIQLQQPTSDVVRTKRQTFSTSQTEKVQQPIAVIVNKEPAAVEVNKQQQTVVPDIKVEQKTTQGKVTDSTVVSNPNETEAIVTENKKETDVDTTAVVKEKPAVTIKPNKKWQIGWQVNGGAADAREQVFTSNKRFSADNSYFVSLIGSAPSTSFAGVVVNEHKVNTNAQFGLGFLLRKPLNKFAIFATGVQYQYSSFTVVDRQRVETYSQQQNRFTTISQTEKINTYRFHYINIPTEVQWQLLKRKAGTVGLATGIHHSFRIGGSNSSAIFASGNKAAVYQPFVSIVPAFEWNRKKTAMQLGWYLNYGVTPVYKKANSNHWWQTGLRVQYYFPAKK